MNDYSSNQKKSLATKVTLIGAALDLALGLLKIFIGVFANSYALVTDGIHSLSDLVSDAFVLLITRVSNEAPDSEHPYGHGRFETIGTIIVGILLFSVAGVIFYDSIRRLNSLEDLQTPTWIALLVAGLSIVLKEWIYRYTKQVAEQINSSILLVNAWHSRSDALSSIAVFIGIIGAYAGFMWMDILAAIFIALMIAKIAWSFIAKSLKELVDTALPKEELHAINKQIAQTAGIVGTHSLRSRLYAEQVFLDIHVQVQKDITVSEGHYIADNLSHTLRVHFPNITDVVVHIDPELDDHSEEELLAPLLPLRDQVWEKLLIQWQDIITKENIEKLNLHYLDDMISAEIFINNLLINKELEDKLKSSIKDIPWLKSLKIYGTF